MTESAVASILVSLLLFLMSMSAVMYGWGEAYLNGRKLASRSEASTLKNYFMSQLTDLEKEGTVFWTFDATDLPSKDVSLISTKKFVSRIEGLRGILNQLESYGVIVDIENEFRKLRKSITLDMERAAKVCVVDRMYKVEEIIQSSEEIRCLVHSSYIKVYDFVTP